ncbi:MAG: GNAT family N-acetyltransferase [bacterium]|nr:GNAT family N-acetyltransferase [bacterium]MCP5068095.1 GNAT family N-acetyltransferase [bacterium]
MRSLIEIQLEVLLERDLRGRLVATRDPLARPAPRLFLGRSAEGNVWATRRDVDTETSDELHRLCSAEPRLVNPGNEQPPLCRERALSLLGHVGVEYRGPCYVIPEKLPSDDRAREITASESCDWPDVFPWLADEFPHIAPVAIAFEDGQAASICHSPRGLTEFAAEAGVETLGAFRGRGLATAAVASWAHAVQRTARLALYSTSWENAASQAVARRLSGKLYGENWHVT